MQPFTRPLGTPRAVGTEGRRRVAVSISREVLAAVASALPVVVGSRRAAAA